jgi:glutamyl-tRNA synthetase/glutamyl-Q tRNA(Asp) synthetase
VLSRLAARLPAHPRTRFAPAPTGYLHLGHVVNAMFVWGLARALGGIVVLRIEDHDRERSRSEYEEALLDDLDWLRFHADECGRASGGVCRQSERGELYQRALTVLDAGHLVYACTCSRRQIERRAEAPGEELRYAGTCRERGLSREAAGLRVRIDDTTEVFEDGLLGHVEQQPAAQCGDVLIRDRRGQWTYQFASTVDDLDQRIDLVVRGMDILPSTGRQLQLARMLGRTSPPVFAHHPLVYARDGVKLSKSNQDAGIRELRDAGYSPDEVLGLAAHRAGLLRESRPLTHEELPILIGKVYRPG